MSDELFFEQLARETGEDRHSDTSPPARLLSRAYSALVRAQEESGPLLDVTATKQAGHPLCVFEELVQILPAGRPVKQMFYCRVCHARLLAENMDQIGRAHV